MTNKNEQRKVPELRFPEFSGEWEDEILKNISKLITKGTSPKNKKCGNVNFLKVENIKNNGKLKITTTIDVEEHNGYLKRSKLKEEDILFSIAGTIGKVIVISKEMLPANTNQALAIIRDYSIDTKFLFYFLQGESINTYIRKNPTVGAQPNLSLEQVGNFIIKFPGINEQQKIGEFFSKLDRQIELEEKKLALLEEQKKEYMQKIFSQELRFKDENGEEYPEWEEVVIKDVFEMEKGYGMTKELLDKEGINSCVLYGELFTTYNEVIDNIVSKTNYSEGRLIESECIIFPNSTTTKAIDLVTFSSLNNLKCYIGGDITILYPKKLTEINTIYMAYYLTNYQKIKKEISKHAQGITIVHLNFNSFKNIKISIPIIEEQIKIAKLLEKIDLNIEFKKNRINYLKVRKKSLLNRLFI